MNQEGIVRRFVEAINARDLPSMLDSMTEDFAFVDSREQALVGKSLMQKAWQGYFALFPDYRIEVTTIVCQGGTIAIFGHASGTLERGGLLPKENSWKIPSCWLAQVKDGRLAGWQVYADNSPVVEIMNRNRSAARNG